jgi:hypothetical protein
VVAHAKLTVAWPEGNEWVAGSETSGAGSGSASGGRSRAIQCLRTPETLSEMRIATPTRVQSHGRLHENPEIATAMASQTIPYEPLYDSASKRRSSGPHRCSTIQRSIARSRPDKTGD